MPQIRQTVSFRKWLMRLEDRTAKARILLVGGDKASQARDIVRARRMIEQLESKQ